jgi:hypothetical protein
MSLFLFTKTHEHVPMSREKKQRNLIYRASGITILVCLVAIALAKLLLSDRAEMATRYVFWLEAAAVVAFGISWLTKGEMFRGDRAGESATPSLDGGRSRVPTGHTGA